MFFEESEEIVDEIARLTPMWLEDTENKQLLRDIRRHFHTFKGNGRAVGANVLGELGWAVQDMLDRVLDGDLEPSAGLQVLLVDVIRELPAVVTSYKDASDWDAASVRELTDRAFRMAEGAGEDLAEGMPEMDEQVHGGAPDAPVSENLGQ